MARIRTVKPELFRHEKLFEAEEITKLPLRFAFIGLFTCCDRDGRFRWRPRQLKLDVLPYDFIDFDKVLDALEAYGFIEKYEVDDECYGCIPSWHLHQSINTRESESILPAKINNDCQTLVVSSILPINHVNTDQDSISTTCGSRVADACPTELPACHYEHVHAHVEKEGNKEKERNKEGKVALVTRHHAEKNNFINKKIISESPPQPIYQDAMAVLEFLNAKVGRNYRPVAENMELIIDRLRSGATVTQCRQVIAKKTREWSNDPHMENFLRPATLFNPTKFEQYVGELLSPEQLEK